MNTYKFTNENKNKEADIISLILKYNGYPPTKARTHEKLTTANNPQKEKWITFTYFGPTIRMVTKIIRNTNLKVVFRTNNTLKRHVIRKDNITDIYDCSGVYQMACKNCPMKYVGQTG
jgi:hypothetical protein